MTLYCQIKRIIKYISCHTNSQEKFDSKTLENNYTKAKVCLHNLIVEKWCKLYTPNFINHFIVMIFISNLFYSQVY